MPPVGFEPTTSAVERPQNHALDRAATGTMRVWEQKNKHCIIGDNEGEHDCIKIWNIFFQPKKIVLYSFPF